MRYLLCPVMALLIMGSFCCAKVESPPVARGPALPEIRGIIAPEEVPAAFDVNVMCVAGGAGGKGLKYDWTADNGTIKGSGNAITWVSPEAPGDYILALKLSEADGHSDSRQAIITVAPFKAAEFTENPQTLLRLHVPGTEMVTDQVKVTPRATCGIECFVTSNSTGNLKYTWGCSGGELMGMGIREGKAASVAWAAPAAYGNYTVTVEMSDDRDNRAAGSVYFQVAESVIPADCNCGKNPVVIPGLKQ